MITISQLSRSLARHLDVADPTNLPIEAAADVLLAINTGIHRFYEDAPAYLSRLTISQALVAPISRSLTFSAQYSKQLTGSPFEASWYGRGVVISGVNQVNEIRGVNEVLDEWLLPNLTVEASILCDAVTLPVSIKRITSDVRLYRSDWNSPFVLVRNESAVTRHRNQGTSFPILDDRPLYYRIEPVDLAGNGRNTSLLRVFPAPQVDVIARFEAEIAASSITMADMVNGGTIPVADQWAGMFLRICEDELTHSPQWRDPATKASIRASTQEVLESRMKKIPNDPGVPNNTVGTPSGY